MAGIKGVGRFAEDLTGQKFGELTVLSKGPTSSEGRARWNCICSCGKLYTTEGRWFRDGRVKSCGHYKGLLAKQRALLKTSTGLSVGNLSP